MDAKTKKKVYIVLLLILAVCMVLWIVTEGVHELGAYIILGFAGAWAAIFLGKILLPKWLSRSEDYYETHSRMDLYGDENIEKMDGGEQHVQ